MKEIILQAKEYEKMVCVPLSEAERHKDSFNHYLNEIVEVIEELKGKDIFPYNSTVVENCAHLNLSEETLSRLVYNSQKYLHNKSAYEEVQRYKETYKDWETPTEENLKSLSKNKTFVLVVGLGKKPFKARPFFDAENNLFWMPPRYTKRGYRLNLTKFKRL